MLIHIYINKINQINNINNSNKNKHAFKHALSC